MSLWSRQTRDPGMSLLDLGVRPRGGTGTAFSAEDVNENTARRQSAVWACVRLRADHVSTLPLDVFRDYEGIAVEVKKKPQVFISPGGDEWPWHDWAWASQADLDLTGNAVGLIHERDQMGIPRVIQLANTRNVSVRVNTEGVVRWTINGHTYRPDQVWHERQNPVSGMILGLSPIAYAAWTISEAMSMQEFALKWFGTGGVPVAMLRNKQKVLKPPEAEAIKERWRNTIAAGDTFVTGNDWEYQLIRAHQMGQEWLEGRKASVPDISRFFNCPPDMIGGAAESGGGTVNYANITQKNLQFLIHHLGPTIIRREWNWSRRLLPEPRYVKLNSDALLRMDPKMREEVIASKLASLQYTITEARALDNRSPYTPEQWAEIEKYQLKKAAAQQPAGQDDEDSEKKPAKVGASDDDTD